MRKNKILKRKSDSIKLRFAFVGFCLIIGNPLSAASLGDLVPHRAVYELQLEKADDKTGISHLNGRMVYEFNGSQCEGFVTRFRYVSRIEMEEGEPRIYDQQTSLFEAGDGSELRVINKNYIDRDLSNELDATVLLEDAGLVVDVTKPQPGTHHLAYALFPTAQMMEMLQKAEEGISFYQTVLYDDFEAGNKITQASVIIGEPRILEKFDDPVWPIMVNYFDDTKNFDGLASYSSQFLIDKKGVSHDLLFDYGDFSMRGTLTKLDLFEQSPCND